MNSKKSFLCKLKYQDQNMRNFKNFKNNKTKLNWLASILVTCKVSSADVSIAVRAGSNEFKPYGLL